MSIDYQHLSGDSASMEFAALWTKRIVEERESRREWVRKLMDQGFKAARPDDGCVRLGDKQHPVLSLNHYDHFNAGANVGDKVALGDYDQWRAVVLTAAHSVFSYTHFSYSEIEK